MEEDLGQRHREEGRDSHRTAQMVTLGLADETLRVTSTPRLQASVRPLVI